MTIATVHKWMLENVAPINWPMGEGLIYAGLLNKDSVWLPAVADVPVSSITPASNEMNVAAYERVQLENLTYSWDSGEEQFGLFCDTVTFPLLESGLVPEAVSGVFICLGNDPDDAVNVLLQSWILDEVVDLTGGDVTVTFGASGLAVVSQEVTGS